MSLITSFYTVLRRDFANNQDRVMFMSANASDALRIMEHLSGRPIEKESTRRYHVHALEGRGKTTDGHVALRSYSQSGAGFFWRVEHTQLATALEPVLEAAARQSQASKDAPTRERRRLRS